MCQRERETEGNFTIIYWHFFFFLNSINHFNMAVSIPDYWSRVENRRLCQGVGTGWWDIHPWTPSLSTSKQTDMTWSWLFQVVVRRHICACSETDNLIASRHLLDQWNFIDPNQIKCLCCDRYMRGKNLWKCSRYDTICPRSLDLLYIYRKLLHKLGKTCWT